MVRSARWAACVIWLAGFLALGFEGFSLRLTDPSRSLPAAPLTVTSAPWEDPPPARATTRQEASRLAEVAHSLTPALMSVGHPSGDAGTAFVIARGPRLLATNAHVATIFEERGGLIATASGSGHRYDVERVWIHPGYLCARSRGVILRGGPVAVFSREVVPDVALLQLAGGGPELPAECTLATREELEHLEGRPVGKLGFEGERSLGKGLTPPAFASGTVSRVSPFAPRWDLSQRWWAIDVSTPVRSGESGGPLFLEGGQIVAINTWGRHPAHPFPDSPNYPIGTVSIRVDALLELLTSSGLSELVPRRGPDLRR